MKLFGTMRDGTPVHLLSLRCGAMQCEIITFGAALRSLTVPDRDGNSVDVLLGFDHLEDYVERNAHLGAVVGRFANRIGGAEFELNGVRYPLCPNDHEVNHLHGGPGGFGRQVWTVDALAEDSATLSLYSPDGQAGYPGAMKVTVTYTLTADALRLSYRAESSKDTLCNLTNHAYFNLAGHGNGLITNQTIRLFSDAYTPTDPLSIPTGEIADVTGTPMDLREPTVIGAHIDDDFQQLQWAGGYDHNFVVRGTPGTLRPAAEVHSDATGITMTAETDQPAIQFYAGNYLGNTAPGKGGVAYPRRAGFCLETQVYPDAPHHPNFPSALLRAGEEYRHETVYRFEA